MKNGKTKSAAGLGVSHSLHQSPDCNFEVVQLSDGRIAYVFDSARDLGPSSTGKTTMVSTTKGALNLPGQPTISVNVFRK